MPSRHLSRACLVFVALGGIAAQAHASGTVRLTADPKPVTSASAVPIVKPHVKTLEEMTDEERLAWINTPVVAPSGSPFAERSYLDRLRHPTPDPATEARAAIEKRANVCYTEAALAKMVNETLHPRITSELRPYNPPTPPPRPGSTGKLAGAVASASVQANIGAFGGAQIQATTISDQDGDHYTFNASLRIGNTEFGPQYDSDKGWSFIRPGSTVPLNSYGASASVGGGVIMRAKGSKDGGKAIYDSQKQSISGGPVTVTTGDGGFVVTASGGVGLTVSGGSKAPPKTGK